MTAQRRTRLSRATGSLGNLLLVAVTLLGAARLLPAPRSRTLGSPTSRRSRAGVNPRVTRIIATGRSPVATSSAPPAGRALITLADQRVRPLVIGLPAGLVVLLGLGQLAADTRTRPDPALGGGPGGVRTA